MSVCVRVRLRLRVRVRVCKYVHRCMVKLISTYRSGVTSVALSTSGRLLFAGEENYELCVWDTLKVERVRTVSKHLNRVSCVGVSIDGNALCTGSWDTTLQIWA